MNSAVQPTILLVDDEVALINVLRPVLSAAGYEVATAMNGREAVLAAAAHPPDVILLDLGLPDADGKDVTTQIRAWSNVPIIVVSARHQGAEKVEALDRGADDYVNKPFDIEELMARVRAALRRQDVGRTRPERYASGGLVIDFARRSVKMDGETIHLSPKEYELLSVLAKSAGQVVTHKRLLAAGWGSDTTDPQYLRVYIGLLRQKLEQDPAEPRLIITEPGIGYRLASQDEAL